MLHEFALNGGIPMILDIIVRTTRQLLGDVGPTIAVVFMHGNENGFLVIRPFALFQERIQMIDKALTTLLTLSSR